LCVIEPFEAGRFRVLRDSASLYLNFRGAADAKTIAHSHIEI
jgi:hypothetical protein